MPRHAWGHAVVEIELWEFGAGARGGHQPFDVIVLHEDLLALARHTLSSRQRIRQKLERHGSCYVCHELTGSDESGHDPVGYAGFDSGPLTEEANRLRYTREWVTETADEWLPRVCPRCSDPRPAQGVLCRAHLLEEQVPDAARDAEVAELDRLAPRLRRLLESMSEHGNPATAEDDASWIQVFGWFHGWSFPLALRSA